MPTLRAGAPNGGAGHGARSGDCKDEYIVPVVQASVAYALQDVRDVQKAQNGRGWNDDGVAYTVDTHATQGVVAFQSVEQAPHVATVAGTLGANHGNIKAEHAWTGQLVAGVAAQAVPPPVAFRDASPTITGNYGKQVDSSDTALGPNVVLQPVVAAFKGGQGSSAGGIGYSEHVTPTLNSADSGSNRTPVVMHPACMVPATAMQVRRLTPEECEALQGFPRGYTMIPWRKKPAELCPDGPRYKALGNSWAVPVVSWIGRRIAEAL